MTVVQKNLIGIDISAKNVKIVKVNSRGNITNYAYVDLPEKVILNGRVESKQMLTETLQIARRKLGSSFKQCALCIDSPDIVIRQVIMPQMEDDFIRKNIAMELSGFLPANPDRYLIDYTVSNTNEAEKKQQLLTFAIPSDAVQDLSFCIKKAGFHLKYIDIMENAYEKLHKMLKTTHMTSQDNFACLYIDNAKSSISVFGNGKFFINKVLDTGVNKICQEISEKTGRPIDIVKNQIYINDFFGNDETFAVERNIVEKSIKDISLDVARVLDYFKSKNNGVAIGAVYASGGFFHLKGILPALQTVLGIPVLDVSSYFNPMFADIPKKDNGVDYTNAIAITLREENS